jgi:hypothetical protein
MPRKIPVYGGSSTIGAACINEDDQVVITLDPHIFASLVAMNRDNLLYGLTFEPIFTPAWPTSRSDHAT